MLSVPSLARANLAVAQAVGTTQVIVDEFGRPLQGTNPAAPDFGLPAIEGDLIQVLQCTDGKIYSPATDGSPDPRNVVLKITRIGMGVNPLEAAPAQFSATLSPRPGGNSKIFIRIFNAASLDEASFYGDSGLFTVKSWKNETFMAGIAATDKPLDAADTDGDGLHNSYEKSYGSDPGASDTDGDGYTDKEESLAGTDLLDEASLFEFTQAVPAPGASMSLQWDSVPGRSYHVEYACGALCENPAFVPVSSVVATGSVTTLTVAFNEQDQLGAYRVCLVE